jgi:uncharacterized HAD superfamily protein
MQWYLKPLKRVYLDIDGVLADFRNGFLDHLNLSKEPESDWADPRFARNFHRVKDDNDFWRSLPALVTHDQLNYPIQGYVTQRPCPTEVTEEWLDSHLFPAKPVITVGGSKLDVLRKLGCDVFVDDNFYTFCELNRNGVLCFLMTRHHNEKYHIEDFLRVDNLGQFFQRVREL